MRALLSIAALTACACDEWEPMQVQERPGVYRASTVFEDGRVMRPMVPETVAQDTYRENAGLMTADLPDGGWVDQMPIPMTRALADQGHLQYDIRCGPCHGLLANGNTVVARKMSLRPPPNLLVAKAGGTLPSGQLPRPLGFYFSVMTHGYGLMPSYTEQLNPTERWAVVAYLQALAFSQRAPLAAAPPDVQTRLAQEQP